MGNIRKKITLPFDSKILPTRCFMVFTGGVLYLRVPLLHLYRPSVMLEDLTHHYKPGKTLTYGSRCSGHKAVNFLCLMSVSRSITCEMKVLLGVQTVGYLAQSKLRVDMLRYCGNTVAPQLSVCGLDW